MLGAAIRRRRKDLGLRGDQLGVSKALLSQYESGKTMPTVATLRLIGEKLACGVDALLYGATAARFHKPNLPPMATLDRRVHDLPEPMREFVMLSLARAENALSHVPAQFLKAPTSSNWPEYAAYLEALAQVSTKKDKA